VRRFFRTPKGLLLIVLGALVLFSAPVEGWRLVWPGLAGATLAAMALDAPILRWREGTWVFPSGALLTGLIVAMILTPHEPWFLAAATAAFAVASKYVVRTRSANVFNPAALALVAAFYVFKTGQDWWGAVPNLHPAALFVLAAGGVFIAQRVNKIPIVLAFLGAYYALFTFAAYVGDPARVAEVFRPPDLNAVLYFVFFMLTDPPTAPTRPGDQITCGVLVAVTGFAAFEWLGAVCYLLIGLLAGNLWEAWRRLRLAARRRSEMLNSPRAASA
jgi:Na+-translocating ferredoxin:NAD+ oxidoreductase RnfD subunit